MAEDPIEYPAIRLILRFWKSSTPSNSGLLGEFIEEYVFSGRFYNAVMENGVEPDPDLTEVSRFMERTICPLTILTYKCRKYKAKRFQYIIRNSEYKLKDCFRLAQLLAKHELWDTFVVLLEGAKYLTLVKENNEIMERFRSLNVNFDSLASTSKEVERLSNDFYDKRRIDTNIDTHSLLYYAIDMTGKGEEGKRENVNVASFLISCFKPPSPYVHYNSEGMCNSVPADVYLTDLKSETAITVYDELISEVTELNKQTCHRWQQVLQDELKVYKSKEESKLLKKIPEIIARRKFREWDSTTKEFYKLTEDNKDRKITDALKRAYFAVTSSSEDPSQRQVHR